MNRRMVFYMTGQLIKAEAALLLLPLLVAALYGEKCLAAFAITVLISLAVGFGMTLLSRPDNKRIYAKEGFVIVALSWLLMSVIGALPFVISREIPNFFDAFFETVSGFTTTGASVVTNVEQLSHGVLFWRSFTHWVGGMGVLVFIMAIVPSSTDRSIHIMKAEVPGPIVGKLVPRVRQTARILYLIYIVMTAVMVVFLVCGDMPFFESLLHAFGTAGTGGLAIKADSVASYSPYLQWVITVFMLLFGINFNLFYFLLLRRFSTVFKNGELWTYLGINIAATAIIAFNIYGIYGSVEESIRLSAFQVSSVCTTTGFATADFNKWPELSKAVLFLLMFIGGMAGSTAGGLKTSRIILMFKTVRREFSRMLHPRSVSVVKLDGKQVDDVTLHSVSSYFLLYVGLYVLCFTLITFDNFDFETSFSAVSACLNNVGPGFGVAGPMGSFYGFSALSKTVLSFAMLFGRLEIYPLLIALSPSTWSKK